MATNLQHPGLTQLAQKQLNLSRSSLHSLQWLTLMQSASFGGVLESYALNTMPL